MRRARLKQRFPSFRHNRKPQSLPYTGSPRYSAMISSSDRLLFAHPVPATRSPSPAPSHQCLHSTATSSSSSCQPEDTMTSIQTRRNARSVSAPLTIRQCTHCTRRLEGYEFLQHPPTARCRHDNEACVYCMHNSVYAAFDRGGWQNVQCLICGEGMSEEEASRLVVLWVEET
jgi:hypothetical protein